MNRSLLSFLVVVSLPLAASPGLGAGTEHPERALPAIARPAGVSPGGVEAFLAAGAYALDVNTIGNRNVALGRDALGANTNGFGNTAIGDKALFSNTTGDVNIAIGDSAGR
jgi:hypothetical protein